MNEIYDFIDLYNISSEEKQREMGVVHHAEGVIKGDEIILNVDLGSTGSDFFQKMLSYFSELSVFRQVVVG